MHAILLKIYHGIHKACPQLFGFHWQQL